MAVDLPRAAGRAALSLGALALGAAAGAAAVRLVMRLSARTDTESDLSEFTSLSGERHDVFTSDGAVLAVDVDLLPGSDFTIVMPHGYALNRHSWFFQRQALRPLANIVVYDQRGHGDSTYVSDAEERDHSIDQLGRDLYSVIQQCVPTRSIILIGHSMGGMSILALADQHPELFDSRVKGVALIATAASAVSSTTLGLPSPIAKLVQGALPAVAGVVARSGDLVARSRWSKSDLGLLLTRLYSFGSVAPAQAGEFVADMIAGTDFSILVDFLPNLYDHDKTDALRVLQKVETLVIVGESDRLTPPEQSEAIISAVPGAEYVVLAESGHMVTLERPTEINELLVGFVDQVMSQHSIAPNGSANGSTRARA
ncbi:MAG: alpha/beta hydrolase [Candidatus Nanopelagicales bacterium]|nr:alpha/beta hydrolase [Candidatus Nanopelagicales bacterium]